MRRVEEQVKHFTPEEYPEVLQLIFIKCDTYNVIIIM